MRERRLERREEGFALIESIAVLALSALVLLTLLIAADLVTRNAALAARRANDVEALATGFAALRRDLAAAKPIRTGGPDGRLLFQGGASSLGLVVEREGGAGGGDDLVWIATEDADGRRLLVRSTAALLPHTADFASAPFGDATALMGGRWSYSFSYRGAGEAANWAGHWSDPERLPAAIRLEVSDRDSGVPVLSPLVVRVNVDAGPGCASGAAASCGGNADPDIPFAGADDASRAR